MPQDLLELGRLRNAWHRMLLSAERNIHCTTATRPEILKQPPFPSIHVCLATTDYVNDSNDLGSLCCDMEGVR